MLSDILSMLKMLKAAIAVFVLGNWILLFFAWRQYMRVVRIEKIT